MIYIDMDGVIADFDKKIKELITEYHGININTLDDVKKGTTWNAVRRYQKAGNGFWRDLEVMDGTYKLFHYLIANILQFEILSAVGSKGFDANSQKIDWIDTHINKKLNINVPINLVISSTNKAEFVKNSTDILIDDRLKSIIPWRAAGGFGILHTNMDNSLHTLQEELSK